MFAGRLRHRVDLQSVAESQSGTGAVKRSWSTYATVWAEVRPAQGGERFTAQRVTAETTHTVRIRWRSGVTTADRVKFGARVFEIESILNPDERDRELVLLCKESE